MSHLLQMRGLKLPKWLTYRERLESHLLQMRGLKHKVILAIIRLSLTVSHLLQMRGLKHKWSNQQEEQHLVASFTDAWIETLRYIG